MLNSLNILWKGKSRRKDKDSPTPVQEEPRQYLEDTLVAESIAAKVDFEKLVRIPVNIDRNEWLATNTISFFEHINLMYGTISEYCTPAGCNSMTGPGGTQYLWFDEKGKKCKCAAPQYVDFVMTFIQKTISEESVFPTKYGNPFPSSFEVLVKKIHRYLFHVLAHIYHAHYKEMVTFGIHGHLNTVFKHFMTMNKEFKLIDEKETDILDSLCRSLEVTEKLADRDQTEDKENIQGATAATAVS
ncbi:MOB kinase activator-like 2 isoform X2 [Lingula anatina]|uniref:MOB kinase activator-like 2 isoform X2 n=1 Tax=Lingula anatina TaxID=7574 RepID=A0A1S3JFE7_LINAN|nr:MOB kinase activator-like 2 isoform X2 [Lingula anatina]|eukprot:XP_013409137.1 MOB kinase activator-like 2 isoform X2 [Lingula anatina]